MTSAADVVEDTATEVCEHEHRVTATEAQTRGGLGGAMAKWGLRGGCSSSSISGTPSAESVPRRVRPPLVLKKKTSKTTVPRRRSHPAVVPQRQPKISQSGEADWMEFIGPVTETREENLRRHGGGLRSCPRCKWYRFSSCWLSTYGSRVRAIAGARGRVCWVQERPARWGGAWALGCPFCAHRADRVSAQGSLTRASQAELKMV